MTRLFVIMLMVVYSLLTFESCSSSRSSAEAKTASGNSRPADPGPGISPDHCRLVATLVRVDDGRSENAADPCFKVACNATIRVEEVLGYGSAFRQPLAKGNEIQVHFLYTLGATSEMFPGMKPGLPGLKVGASFEADLFAGEEQIATQASKRPSLTVGTYTVR